MSEDERIGVLFVCYANMCRSPLAEGVFRHLAEQRGLLGRLRVDSAGTDAAEGCPPHPLSCEIAERHGIRLEGAGRQLLRDDLSRFDHVVVMDRRNYAKISRLAQLSVQPRSSGGGRRRLGFGSARPEPPPGTLAGYRARLRTLRSIVDPNIEGPGEDIPDPIGRGAEHYAEAYALIVEGCEALLDEIEAELAG
jgi:protein-tyrosine phosphatase